MRNFERFHDNSPVDFLSINQDVKFQVSSLVRFVQYSVNLEQQVSVINEQHSSSPPVSPSLLG